MPDGVRQGGFVGSSVDAEMDQLAQVAGQSVADRAQRTCTMAAALRAGFQRPLDKAILKQQMPEGHLPAIQKLFGQS